MVNTDINERCLPPPPSLTTRLTIPLPHTPIRVNDPYENSSSSWRWRSYSTWTWADVGCLWRYMRDVWLGSHARMTSWLHCRREFRPSTTTHWHSLISMGLRYGQWWAFCWDFIFVCCSFSLSLSYFYNSNVSLTLFLLTFFVFVIIILNTPFLRGREEFRNINRRRI